MEVLYRMAEAMVIFEQRQKKQILDDLFIEAAVSPFKIKINALSQVPMSAFLRENCIAAGEEADRISNLFKNNKYFKRGNFLFL